MLPLFVDRCGYNSATLKSGNNFYSYLSETTLRSMVQAINKTLYGIFVENAKNRKVSWKATRVESEPGKEINILLHHSMFKNF